MRRFIQKVVRLQRENAFIWREYPFFDSSPFIGSLRETV
jgi:hypothetical protein